MAAEIRAIYGGIEMAIVVLTTVFWRRGDSFAALLIGVLPLVGSATGRCVVGLIVSMVFHDTRGFHWFESGRRGVLFGWLCDAISGELGWMSRTFNADRVGSVHQGTGTL